MTEDYLGDFASKSDGEAPDRGAIPPERFVQLAAIIAIAPAIAVWVLLGSQSVWIRIAVIGVIATAVEITMIWGRPTPAELQQRQRHSGAIETEERIWLSATSRHDQVLAEYYPYESDPKLLLQFPALTDIQQAPTADFFEALHDAVALRTDRYPESAPFAEQYLSSVRNLVRAWDAAKRHAQRVATTYLNEVDARKADRAAKLLAQAQSTTEAHERTTYLAAARTLVDELRSSGAIVLPPMAAAAIEAASRRAIGS